MSGLTNPIETISIYLATTLRDWARFFGKLARRAVRELYLRNATRTLQQFDDRILADIGLRRVEIDHAVRNGRLATPKTVANRTRSQHRHAA